MARYSSGAYLYVLDRDVPGWQRRVDYLRTLPGLGHVEVWCELPDLAADEINALRGMLAGWQVLVHAPYLQLSMISHHDMVRGAAAEIYRRTMALSDQLGAAVTTFQAGTRPFFLDEGVMLEQIWAMFHALRQTGSRSEPTLKNMMADGNRLVVYPAGLAELQRCMDHIPDLKVTLDVGHAVQSGDNWIAFLRASGGRVANIHLHDAQPEGRSHLCLGTGAMDSFALARMLRNLGYTGYVTLATMGQRDTSASWQLWRDAQAEASEETTATVRE
jgi:sugar phosphate isomerase/epimerase